MAYNRTAFAACGALAGAILFQGALARVALAAPTCSSYARPLAGVAGMPEVREYRCAVDGPGTGVLNVFFARLNEVLVSNLIMGEALPEVDKIFPNARIVDNEITAELKLLVKEFARKTTEPEENVSFAINVKSAGSADTAQWKSTTLPGIKTSPRDGERHLWSIASPFGGIPGVSGNYQIVLKRANEQIYKTNKWPDGLKHFYKCTQSAILCMTLWGYIGAEELDAIERDTNKMVEDAEKKAGGSTAAQDKKSDAWEEQNRQYAQHFKLFKHLAKGGLPQDFLFVFADNEACAGYWEYSYSARPLAVDVAIIENTSNKPVAITDLVGRRAGTKSKLTSVSETAAGPAGKLLHPEFSIPPRSRAIVPLRAVFSDVTRDWQSQLQLEQSKRMFQLIKAKPANAVFQSDIWEMGDPSGGKKLRKDTVRKTRDSFQEPSLPTSSEYKFGTALGVSGFVVRSGSLDVDGGLLHEIALTNESDNFEAREAGQKAGLSANEDPPTKLGLYENISPGRSCPVLYSWSPGAGSWTKLRKVIDFAQGESNEGTDVVGVRSGALRFRISEEEPETAYIRKVQLSLSMRDGSRLALQPVKGISPTGLTPHARIPAYSYADYEFELPAGVARADIEKAELAITGYYRRYSSMLGAGVSSTQPRARATLSVVRD